MDIIIIDGLSFALPLFIMAIGGITKLNNTVNQYTKPR